MENQPRRNKYYIEWNGENIYFTPENTMIYLHKYEPHYDHIFVDLDPDAEASESGVYIWRITHENFDEMVAELLRNGVWQKPDLEFATKLDKQSFDRHGLVLPPAPEIPPLEELLPRKEAHARFLEYLIENDYLTDEEFASGNGELYI